MSQDTAVLLKSLNQVRHHVLGIVEDLSEADLRRPVLPSGWSCLGLVNHLAVDVERFWFRAVTAGEQTAWDTFDDDDVSGWSVPAGTPSAETLALYRDEIARADQILQATPLEAAPARWPEEMFGEFRLPDVRAVMLHVITETACHAGHLDAARELIDGRQWFVI